MDAANPVTDSTTPPLGARLLELTTANTTATSVAYLPDGEQLLLIATGEPPWYRDLLEHRRAAVQAGSLSYQADATPLVGEDRDRLIARAVEADPGWNTAGLATAPVVALTPVFDGPPPGPFGDQLVKVHGYFREELALIRAELERAGPGLVAQLRVNCLTFCHQLHEHHTGESGRIFPMLAQREPALAPVLARLDREHEVVKRLLDDIQELLRSGAMETASLLAEFDRLMAELEAHLAYEEEQLVGALNQVTLGPAPDRS